MKQEFQFKKLSEMPKMVNNLVCTNSGILIQISGHELLKNLKGAKDGFYLVEGIDQVVKKEGDILSVVLMEDKDDLEIIETRFVDALGVSFFDF